MGGQHLRVAIVAEHASARFGGEAFLPLHYFRLLRRRGIEAWLVCHERVADEMKAAFPNDRSRLSFVPDLPIHRTLWSVSRRLPARLGTITTDAASQFVTQILQRRVVRQLVTSKRIDVVHVPIPVSPKLPCAIHDVGAPVVIGPMNGGMDYPEGFSHLQGRFQRAGVHVARHASEMLNRAIPGKRRAAALLVANARTRAALPRAVSQVPVIEMSENGVDLDRFALRERVRGAGEPVRFAFVGRLIRLKAVDLLLRALARAAADHDVTLDILGDGCERERLEVLANTLGVENRVRFHGFVPQSELPDRLAKVDALVMPSLMECGGAVVLEAMALGLPVIATRWGGPADYLDPSCGILIDPTNPEQMTHDLAWAIRELCASPETRAHLGRTARAKIIALYDWEDKLDRVLALYDSVTDRVQVPGEHERKPVPARPRAPRPSVPARTVSVPPAE